jgi:hypothetical protein
MTFVIKIMKNSHSKTHVSFHALEGKIKFVKYVLKIIFSAKFRKCFPKEILRGGMRIFPKLLCTFLFEIPFTLMQHPFSSIVN